MAIIFAFLGFFTFCLLEICLRSIELFYLQIQLPAVYRQTADIAEQKAVTDFVANFQSVQLALYFPLMWWQMIGSIILAAIFKRNQRLNYLIIIAFALNAVRLIARICGMFLHINWFDSFSENLYLPFVYVIFGLIGIWLLLKKNEVDLTINENGEQKERSVLLKSIIGRIVEAKAQITALLTRGLPTFHSIARPCSI